MRVMLFTDTLGDVNGVSRFVRTLARDARDRRRDLLVVTSTRRRVEAADNIANVPPRFARPMPGYPDLDVVLPAWRAIAALARAWRPDVVHVSTPGPVGWVGRAAARRLRVPLVGVYHTDFPAYARRLFDDEALAWIGERGLRWFYAPFARVLARSHASARAIARAGLDGARDGGGSSRVIALPPGVALEEFHPRVREPRAPVFRALYVGRVSVEKNLALLASVWRGARERLAALAIDAELLIVGDGPGRARLEESLAGTNARCTGFLHGEDLARAYASGDALLFPSATDTLGQVVLEAQASGVPALVTDRGGPHELVRDGETGFVLPADHAAPWVERVVTLAADPARREAMARAARAHAESFDARRMADAFWRAHEAAAQ